MQGNAEAINANHDVTSHGQLNRILLQTKSCAFSNNNDFTGVCIDSEEGGMPKSNREFKSKLNPVS